MTFPGCGVTTTGTNRIVSSWITVTGIGTAIRNFKSGMKEDGSDDKS